MSAEMLEGHLETLSHQVMQERLVDSHDIIRKAAFDFLDANPSLYVSILSENKEIVSNIFSGLISEIMISKIAISIITQIAKIKFFQKSGPIETNLKKAKSQILSLVLS